MKKRVLFFTLLAAAVSASAMNYYSGKHRPEDPAEKNLKWSTCRWGNNVDFETEDMPGKPGPNDDVSVRPGGFTLEIDGNYTVRSFNTSDGSRTFAKGRTLKLRKLRGTMSTSNRGCTKQEWEKCNIIVNGHYEISFWHEARQAGRMRLQYVDTKLAVKGNFVLEIPANPIIKNELRAGVEFYAEGDSQLLFNGGAFIDPIIADQNEEYMFKWAFKEKDGKFPYVFFNKPAQFKKCDIEFSVSDKVKPGRYPLLEFADKKSGLSEIRSITVNGNEYKLGDPIKLGKRTGKLIIGAAGKKDPKTENDLVFEVSK